MMLNQVKSFSQRKIVAAMTRGGNDEDTEVLVGFQLPLVCASALAVTLLLSRHIYVSSVPDLSVLHSDISRYHFPAADQYARLRPPLALAS